MYEIEIAGRIRQVTVLRVDGRFEVTVDGVTWNVDAARVDQYTWSLLVDREVHPSREPDARRTDAAPAGISDGRLGRSHEITVAGDPAGGLRIRVGAVPIAATLDRRQAGRHDDHLHSGPEPQRIVAPMPGKVVRVLVEAGAEVRARQPVIVVEAMKMENELRASRDGAVLEIVAKEGQSVEAGSLLAILT
jgi:biotin carboxyl carrier protein